MKTKLTCDEIDSGHQCSRIAFLEKQAPHGVVLLEWVERERESASKF